MPGVIRLHPDDTVAVALDTLAAGHRVDVEHARLTLGSDVPAGHKLAVVAHEPGAPVVKYGYCIGIVTEHIAPGDWVHSHNLKTRLEGVASYRYEPAPRPDLVPVPATFDGYRRATGRVGTRNEIWILNTVGCVNHAADHIARIMGEKLKGQVDGVYAFSHPYGCSQLGDDLRNTQRVLAGLLRHPNAAGVLVLGLGCENNQLESLLQVAGDVDRERLRFFNLQDVIDEVEQGTSVISELARHVVTDRRVACSASELVLGHKCGGSDGFSGISANPVVGRIADMITASGGKVLLTEIPEMFGAEQVLMNRAADRRLFEEIVGLVDGFKAYFRGHGQPIYENPSPGNKTGGLTTLEEKSLGAIQKGGRATITQVLPYGAPATVPGLALLESPGNDGVSSTALVASGATVLLFTTGRGTPLGFPAPTIKISSNSEIAVKKPHWIDFDAGPVLEGTATLDQLAAELLVLILDVASGRRRTRNEEHGYREIAIWKEGVTL